MTVTTLILFILTGCIAGFLNVMAGGGSLIAMPVMIMTGMDPTIANGSNRVAILVQNISATAGFFKKGFSDFKLSLSLALCTLPGAIAGAYFGTIVPDVWFKRILAAIMIAILLLMVRGKRSVSAPLTTETPSSGRLLAAHLLMIAAGVYGGFIQAGVGFVFIAILHNVLRLDLVRVNMHKVFIIGVYTIVALAVFAFSGAVDWLAGGSLAIGNAAGGWVGAHVAVRKGEKWIRIILYVALVALAINLLVPRSFFSDMISRLFS